MSGEQAFPLSVQQWYKRMGRALALVAWTCAVVTVSFQQQGGVKAFSFPALHPGAVTQWHCPWPSVAIHTAAASWGLLVGYSPFSPRRKAFSPQCHRVTEALRDLHDRALPAPGPRVLRSSPFPSISPHALPGCLP